MLIGAVATAIANVMESQQDEVIQVLRRDLREAFASLTRCTDRLRLQVAAH